MPCLQVCEVFQEGVSVLIHSNQLKGGWMKEGKGKVEMCQALHVKVLRRYLVTRPRRGPRLVVANGAPEA